MLWLYILIGVIAVLALAELGIAVYFFNYAIKRHPYDPYKKAAKYPEEMKDELAVYEEAKKGLSEYGYDTVELLSRDGLNLKARYYHSKASLCHTAATYFCRISERAAKAKGNT